MVTRRDPRRSFYQFGAVHKLCHAFKGEVKGQQSAASCDKGGRAGNLVFCLPACRSRGRCTPLLYGNNARRTAAQLLTGQEHFLFRTGGAVVRYFVAYKTLDGCSNRWEDNWHVKPWSRVVVIVLATTDASTFSLHYASRRSIPQPDMKWLREGLHQHKNQPGEVVMPRFGNEESFQREEHELDVTAEEYEGMKRDVVDRRRL
ncbi:hypothetical protein EVAR_81391_1 [Eumeta japonica]|uniref:Uncharacterized protein n=1 Tax=Eumeta variegata TaxID=151549 RepID=A0A4C1WGY3_EUMVA|nr:hypothetical protein EVAR_81391_1 [Eumeta japonica]